MPYLAVELDAKKQMHHVARAAGIPVAEVAWGLLELWEHVWSTEADVVSPVVLDGCIGEAPKLRPALVAFGFLEPIGDAFRVRGAERYLRVRRAQRDGGKLGRARSSSPVGRQGDPAAAEAPDKVTSKVTLGSTSGSTPRSRQALTPSTEHRAPKDLKTAPGPKDPSPTPPLRRALSDALCEIFQVERRTPYVWQGAKDGVALDWLLKAVPPEEIRARWSRGLKATGWQQVATIAQLRSKWNDLAPSPTDIAGGSTLADAVFGGAA